ncbi:MAG: C39 family peptidase [Chloroflexi bacterium]|nr:C39 family peptidase [Chloroflexota bacterium]
MSARHRRLRILPILLAIGLLVVGSAPAGAASTYSRDLFFAAGYEHQVDSRTCTAASTAMMMNFIARRDLKLSQLAILRYEQPRDALSNATQRGSDPLGWSKAATYFSRYTGRPTTYRWEAYSSASRALRRAATQIAITGKPVGLLVRYGTHAMVMTGFTVSSNPAHHASFTLSSVWISDPYGYSHRSYAAGSTPLNRYLQTDATPYYDLAWYGKYVIVVPQG